VRLPGNYDTTFSISFEYLHAATLLHDDLIDEAELRRGRPVAHSLYGNATTVLVGDFLLARALSLAARTGKIEIIKVVAGITENMSQGEIHQFRRKGDIADGGPNTGRSSGARRRSFSKAPAGRPPIWPMRPRIWLKPSRPTAPTWAWPFRWPTT
jgi:hypothetical protein